MANDLGYGNGIFYPQLSYYVTIVIFSFMKHIGVVISLITAIKIYEFLILFLSGVFMYKFMKKTFSDKNVGLVSSIMYMTAPYFINDIFIRMSFGEISVFLFLPIIMLSITYILNKDYIKFIIFFTLGYVGMIYSHLVLTLFFTILLIIFLIIHIKELFNIKTILSFIISVITVLSITSPFLIPMFEHKVSGDYVVFRDGEMTNIQKIENNRLSMDEIFNKNTDKVVIVYNNIIVLAFSAITLVNLKNIVKDKSRRKFIIGIFIFTLVSIFISSEFVNWRNVPEIFWLIQFPWRMCMFIAFGTSIIGGLGILYFKKENFKVLFLIILVICLLDASAVSHYRELRIEPEINRNYVSNIDSFSLGGCREYLPVKSKENIEYLQKRTKKVEIIDGKANVKIIKNNTPYIKFEIKLDSDSAKIELPRIYYLGYDIKIKDENGNIEKLEYYENDKGLIEINLDKSGIITTHYTGTTLNKFANIIAIIGVIGFIGLCIFELNKKKNIDKKIINNDKILTT